MNKATSTRSDSDVLQILIMGSVSIAIGWPLLFSTRIFGGDWPLHVLLVEAQIEAIGQGLLPTIFSNFPQVGYFYPTGIFLGGNFYAILGYLGLITGPFYAIALTTILLIFYVQVSFRGITRNFAHLNHFSMLPGIVFISAAYFLGDLFGRGGISSVYALSGLPIIIYSFLELANKPNKVRHKVGILIGTVLIFATHNISTLWIFFHITFWLILLSISLFLKGNSRGNIRNFFSRHKHGFSIFIISMLITSWSMLPNLFLADNLNISKEASIQKEWSKNFSNPSNLFSLMRRIPPEHKGTDLFVQFPTLVFLATIFYLFIAYRRNILVRSDKTVIFISLASLFFTLLFIYALPLYEILPSVFLKTQFTFRLNHFLYLSISFLVLMAVLTEMRTNFNQAKKASSASFKLLVCVILISLFQGIWQSSYSNQESPGERTNRSITYWSSFWYSEEELRLRDDLPNLAVNSVRAITSGNFIKGKLTFPVESKRIAVPVQGPVNLLDFCGGKPIGRDKKLLVLSYEEPTTSGCVQSKRSILTTTSVVLTVIGLLLFMMQLIRRKS